MKSIRKDTETKAPVPGYRLMRLTNRISSTLTLTVILASFALQASAATVFNDNFNDGDAKDGMPVTWTEQTNSGDYDATSGDYVFTPTTTDEFMISSVVDEVLTDVSIRTQVLTSMAFGGAFVSARVQDPLAVPSIGNYFAGIEYRPSVGGTVLILGRNDFGSFTPFGGNPVLPFDVRTEDGVLQLDVIGDDLRLWGWKAGDPMPDQPQLTATDSTYSEGTMRITGQTTNNNITTFRYVHVADSQITPLSCDFTGDGSCNVEDIDALIMEIVAGTHNTLFDLTDDGNVDLDDRDAWLAEGAAANGFGSPYLLGDADLSGTVDFIDLNMWSENRFSPTPAFSAGDWDASGFVDFIDLNLWSENRFQSSDSLVPEPSAMALLLFGLITLKLCCQKRPCLSDIASSRNCRLRLPSR